MSTKAKKDKIENKDIKKALDKIPGLIFEQVKFTPPPKEEKKDKPQIQPENSPKEEKKRKKLMWLGVIIITLIILLMWSWNTFINFDTLSKNKKSTFSDQFKKSFEQVKKQTAEFEPKINTTNENELKNKTIEEKIKNNLTVLINKLNNTTSTTSTTIISTSTDKEKIESNITTSSPKIIRSL